MTEQRALPFFTALAIVLVACFLGAITWAALRTAEPPHEQPRGRPRTHEITEPNLADLPATEALMTYLSAVREQQIADVGAYIAAVQEAELAAYLEAITPPPPPVIYTAPQPSVAGACGGATNGADQFIQRESGGQPYIANGGGTAASPFDAGRAFGCYQIIPSTWAAACSDITTYDPASQARCASRLPLSAWAL
jgi:hypothetical protein